MPIYAVITNGRMIQGRSLRDLCQKLTNKGLNVPNVRYEVFDFHTEIPTFTIGYIERTDSWGKWVPEEVIPAHYEFIKDTTGLTPQGPPKLD